MTVYNKVTLDNEVLIDLSSDTVSSASHIMAGYYGHLANGNRVLGTGQGGSDQSLIKSADLTMSETYTSANKLTVALEPRNACVILGWADELPPAPESGYTAFFFSYFIAPGITKQQDGRIMRANGTVGNDANMFGFNTTTGVLTLGGQYGYFREGMTYHIRQYEF